MNAFSSCPRMMRHLMTWTNTASSDHTNRISPLSSPSYHVQRLTRCLHWSNLQGSLRHPGFFSLLPLPCSSRKLAAGGRFTFFFRCHSLIFHILLFISFRSAQHTSVNWIDQVVHGLSIFYLLEQKYDHDYHCPDWTNALREMKGINFNSWRTGTIQPLSKTVQEYCKQREWDMKNKNFQASSIVWKSNKGRVPGMCVATKTNRLNFSFLWWYLQSLENIKPQTCDYISNLQLKTLSFSRP